ncbi:response regulator [Marinobacterium jannaschii]|uniref:response regulator n=1 Tax=Marinobacterium jannaschii TaxID=64970 RepID=UPI000B234B90|nr:response regulator [Marinobacterium jannaschii]
MMDLTDLYVVVVEPSNLQRNIICDRLRSFGIEQIDEFTEATPAWESMLKRVPDIAVSSMHLPDMTGTELVNQMREHPALRDVTFLLISSETHYRYLEPIRQAGAIAILPKPFSRDELCTALRSTLHYISDTSSEHHDEDHEDLSVLLVDDSRMSRKVVRKMLDALAIGEITEAGDGSEALERIRAGQRFDLIVTDYNMPNVDGKELTEHIRHHSDIPTVPIMMITSEQNESHLAAIQQAGVSAICSKPLSYEMVKVLIEQLVNDLEI